MISINQVHAVTIVQKIALYCSSYNGNDVYYLKEAIMLMINLFGENKLVEMLKNDESANSKVTNRIGEDWFKENGMKRKLIRFSKILEEVNKSYSILEDKKVPKEKKNEIKYQDFLKCCKYLPRIENDLYALFVFMVENSSIRNMNISQQYLKVLEQGKTFGGLDKKKVRDESNKLQQ